MLLQLLNEVRLRRGSAEAILTMGIREAVITIRIKYVTYYPTTSSHYTAIM